MEWIPAPHRLRLPGNLQPEPGQQVALDNDESHHLLRVRRAREGSRVDLLDGSGTVYSGPIEADGLIATIRIDDLFRVERARPRVTLALALLKGGNFEEALQRGTELGLHRLIPLECTRCEARLAPDKVAARVERWRAISWEACKQSANPWVPVIDAPMPVDRFAVDRTPGKKLIGTLDPETRSLARALQDDPEAITLAIGPEGDWTDAELATLTGNGFAPTTLGPTILRAETAAVAALSAIRALSIK